MNKEYGYINLDKQTEKLLKKGEFLGCGHNGIVFLLSKNRVLKIFKDTNVAKKEDHILRKSKNSKSFPKVYKSGHYYIVRDYVGGKQLDKYIKKHGFNKQIAINLVKLLKEFKRLNFEKIDIRCKDLYLQKDFKIMVIDPKNNFSKKVVYPRHLMKGLNKLGVLDEFLEVVKEESPKDYELWSSRMKKYLETGIK